MPSSKSAKRQRGSSSSSSSSPLQAPNAVGKGDLWIGNMPATVTADEIKKVLERYGTVKRLQVKVREDTERQRQSIAYAFVHVGRGFERLSCVCALNGSLWPLSPHRIKVQDNTNLKHFSRQFSDEAFCSRTMMQSMAVRKSGSKAERRMAQRKTIESAKFYYASTRPHKRRSQAVFQQPGDERSGSSSRSSSKSSEPGPRSPSRSRAKASSSDARSGSRSRSRTRCENRALLKHLPSEISQKAMLKVASVYGKVLSVRLWTYHGVTNSIIEYSSRDEMEYAVKELDGRRMEGCDGLMLRAFRYDAEDAEGCVKASCDPT